MGRKKCYNVCSTYFFCYDGYKIEEIVLDEEIQKISATNIRAKMREEGKLK